MIHDSILVLCFQVLSAKKRSLPFTARFLGRSFLSFSQKTIVILLQGFRAIVLGSLTQKRSLFYGKVFRTIVFISQLRNDRYFTASLEGDRYFYGKAIETIVCGFLR